MDPHGLSASDPSVLRRHVCQRRSIVRIVRMGEQSSFGRMARHPAWTQCVLRAVHGGPRCSTPGRTAAGRCVKLIWRWRSEFCTLVLLSA